MSHRRPSDDPRRRYATFLQIGLAAALSLSVAAFTVPLGPDAPETFIVHTDAPIEITEIPPTAMTPPPPPPPAPPPPIAVPDEVEVETVVESLELRLDEALPPPVLPPPDTPTRTSPIQPPTPPVLPPEEYLPPPVEPPVVIPPVQEIFDVVEQQPELIGGLDELQRRVEYPRLARDAGIQGRVFIQFIVDERGQVTDPVVLRSPSNLLSRAALDAVRASRFVPGSQRGKPVKVRYSLPVNFVLN